MIIKKSFLVKITPLNDTPDIYQIPTQTIEEGGSFEAIYLDNYINDVETIDGNMIWVAEFGPEYSVSIVDRVATIIVTNSDFNGQEKITFTATDTGDDSDVAISVSTNVTRRLYASTPQRAARMRSVRGPESVQLLSARAPSV